MKKILLVDDEQFIHKMLSDFINQYIECEVKAVTDVDQALEYIKETPIDLVLLDINMRGSTSLYFVESLQDLPDRKDTPVVVVSSMSFDEMKAAFEKRGVTQFFSKSSIMDEAERAKFIEVLKTLLHIG